MAASDPLSILRPTNSNGCRGHNVDFFWMVHMWLRKFNNVFSSNVFDILLSRLCSFVDCEHFLLVRISKSILRKKLLTFL